MTPSDLSSDIADPPLIIVLTGPSGVGKDALVNRMVERGCPIVRPATMTTREPREGEQEGVHHYFVDRDQFLQAVEDGELLEHAEVYGNLYGVPRHAVRAARESAKHVVIRVDVQGAETLRDVIPGALFLSLEPSAPEALREHLDRRGSESAEEMERRLEVARDEMRRARAFCLPVVNVEDDLDATVESVLKIIRAEQARADRAAVEV